jgi:hypothetical protein
VWGFLDGVKKARAPVPCGVPWLVARGVRLRRRLTPQPVAQKIEYEMNYENWAPRGAFTA